MGGNTKKYLVELVGTAVLVLMGCGSVAIAGYGPSFPVGMLPVALAFGIAVTAMAYAIGPVSGCHINPAVTASFWAAGRMSSTEAIGYIVSQVVGGIVGTVLIIIIVKGKIGGYDIAASGLGQNGWGEGYGGGFGMGAAIVTEIVATFIFTLVILNATHGRAGAGLVAGLIIGLTLVIIHVVFIPVTGVSVNPARSLGPAIFVGGQAIAQVWLFIVMPLIGGLIAGWVYRAKLLTVDD
ncbi:MAG: aquaporin [Bauldia sp.]